MASIVDAIDDVNKDVIQCHFEADETKKVEMKKKLVEETLLQSCVTLRLEQVAIMVAGCTAS